MLNERFVKELIALRKKSVPPRGSGWVLTIEDCGLHIADWEKQQRPTRYRVVVLTSHQAALVLKLKLPIDRLQP